MEVVIPQQVRAYAKRTKAPDKVLACWQLVENGELTLKDACAKLGIVYGTGQRWMQEARAQLDGTEGDSREVVEALSLEDVATRRAGLLADAEKLPLEQRIKVQSALLADEQRRLGGDRSIVEQQSITLTLQAMAPQERQQELAQRLTRMAERGTLPAAAGELLSASPTGVPSPPGPTVPPLQSLPKVQPKNFENQSVDADYEEIEDG